ncbi:MAG: Asp-tRNA(Asn)/Glu-tRNA(Gln) amidotransferase subunit GatC [Planctomycetes bacterium]|nr:Asp-tRNA(Asn)/Glu-tRNA(Gln) amidotransferase subunit GatC [Planctomycetota bacterium]
MSEMPIDRTELQRLCDLARLHLPAERETEYLGQLGRIVAAFAALKEVDTTAMLAPTGSQDPGPTPLRADEPAAPLPTAEVLANAPRAAGDCFVVPRVVDA